MNHHKAVMLEAGPLAGRWVYCSLNKRGSHVECCADEWYKLAQADKGTPWSAPGWATTTIGHATEAEALACMRARLWDRLRLDGRARDWSGCRAPVDGGVCDTPTKGYAEIPPMYFHESLCDQHRTRAVVEAMWDGPGEWWGSW